MEYQLFSLFPTPILCISDFISEKERIGIFNKIKNTPHYKHKSVSNGGSCSHDDKGNFIKNNFLEKEIILRIEKSLNEFAKIYGIPQLKISNYWYNIEKKGSHLFIHRHPNSKISGSLYINVSENCHKLHFFNQNPFVRFELFEELNDFNYSACALTPKNGTLFLFPSWLEHSSANETSGIDNRIVVSFNSVYVN
jgi:uncharacterized protein (TIGR02466 family)